MSGLFGRIDPVKIDYRGNGPSPQRVCSLCGAEMFRDIAPGVYWCANCGAITNTDNYIFQPILGRLSIKILSRLIK